MSQKLFKWKHFEAEIIMMCIRWYFKYLLSYRMLVEMQKRGLKLTLRLTLIIILRNGSMPK